jgi:CHAD domain-containing protein
MRVAARRARAALRLFAGGAPPRVEGALDRELRWLGSELGAVRDLDVQIAWVEQERRDLAGNRARAFGAFVADLRRLRAKRQTHLRAVLSSARYHHLLVRLERFADGSGGALGAGAGRAPVATVGADRLATAIETLCRRGRRVAKCAGEPSAEDLHALRIRAKRVRYALEFLAPFTGAPGHALVKRLVALQDILGAHQDAVVAAAFVRAHRKRGARSRALAYEGLLWATRRRAARARARFRGVFREFDRPRARRDARETIRAVRAAHTGT